MKKPEKLLYSSGKYREILSVERRKKYAANYSEETVRELKQKLWNERKPKIEKINQKLKLPTPYGVLNLEKSIL